MEHLLVGERVIPALAGRDEVVDLSHISICKGESTVGA